MMVSNGPNRLSADKRTVVVVAMAVVVCVRVFLWADVVHLVCRATLHTARDGFLTGQLRRVRETIDMMVK